MLPRALAIFVFLLGAAVARAEEPARYSDRGRSLLGGSVGGTWYTRDPLPGETTRQSWSVAVEPSWIYFVRERIGLGGYVGYGAGKGEFLGQGRYFDQGASAGFTGAFECWASGPWGLLLRPSVGLSARFRTFDSSVATFVPLGPVVVDVPVSFDPNPYFLHEKQRDLRGQLQLRTQLVYALSSSMVLGIGPDLLYESMFLHSSRGTRASFNGFRVALTSFVGATF